METIVVVCSECGAPIENLGVPCPKCGYDPTGYVVGTRTWTTSSPLFEEVTALRSEVDKLKATIARPAEERIGDVQQEFQRHVESLSDKLDKLESELAQPRSLIRGVAFIEDISVSLVQTDKVDRFSFLERWSGIFFGLTTLTLGAFISGVAAPNRPAVSGLLGLTQTEWLELIFSVILGIVTAYFHVRARQAEQVYKETSQSTRFALTISAPAKERHQKNIEDS